MTANGSSAAEQSDEASTVEPSVEDIEETEGGSETDSEAEVEPTPQPAALRQQQYYVGIGGAVLGGGALMTGVYQRFPDAPAIVPVLAGVFATGLLIWLVRKSIFPGSEDASGI